MSRRNYDFDDDDDDNDGQTDDRSKKGAAPSAEMPHAPRWPLVIGGLLGLAIPVALTYLTTIPVWATRLVGWPTWMAWFAAAALLLHALIELAWWQRIAGRVPAAVDAKSFAHSPVPWLTIAAHRCLDVTVSRTAGFLRPLVDGEATVYRAYFLESVRGRLGLRLCLAFLLALGGVWTGLYYCRRDSNFFVLNELAGIALAALVAAGLLAVVAVLTSFRAENALRVWHRTILERHCPTDELHYESHAAKSAKASTSQTAADPAPKQPVQSNSQPKSDRIADEIAKNDRDLDELLGLK